MVSLLSKILHWASGTSFPLLMTMNKELTELHYVILQLILINYFKYRQQKNLYFSASSVFLHFLYLNNNS